MPGPHVNVPFQIRKWSKVHHNDQTVLIFGVKDEQTCLHICAKRICDRLLTFDIIDQMACRSYGEQDSSVLITVIVPSWVRFRCCQTVRTLSLDLILLVQVVQSNVFKMCLTSCTFGFQSSSSHTFEFQIDFCIFTFEPDALVSAKRSAIYSLLDNDSVVSIVCLNTSAPRTEHCIDMRVIRVLALIAKFQGSVVSTYNTASLINVLY
jgi:hypothetical protein